jgi:ferrous iron transport protein B
MGEMGFVRGKKITVIKNAPLNDPVEFSIMGYNVSLRRSEAEHILVSAEQQSPEEYNGTLAEVIPRIPPAGRRENHTGGICGQSQFRQDYNFQLCFTVARACW